MKIRPYIAHLKAVASALAILLFLPFAHSQTASQTITLIPGWNAIWLEVNPVYPAGHPREGQAKGPAEFFGDALTPAETEKILIVTSPKPLAGTAAALVVADSATPKGRRNLSENSYKMHRKSKN